MTREELQRLYDEATGKYRAAGIARGYSAQAVPALLGALGDYLAEPDPTVEIAYLKAKLADVEAGRDQGAVKALTARAEAAEQAVQRVRAIHYAADNDLARTPVCSNCEGRAGVHDCGCWADEDRQPVCGHCNEGWNGASAPWPCATVRALDGGAS